MYMYETVSGYKNENQNNCRNANMYYGARTL